MTHPTTPPPPPGPGKATPLTADQRADNYRRQNGSPRLTARQQRRSTKKANRALVGA